MTDKILRIGVLGAARITPGALTGPASQVAGVEVVCVAARDHARAEKFAAQHGIPDVVDDYEAVIRHPDVDAVYNPLPASLHAEWSIRAMEAGKHVLCEKPFACNAARAAEMLDVSARTGMVLVEAFHWCYHPLAARLLEVVRDGELGELVELDASFNAPIPPNDIRRDVALGGGAMMDLGCYTLHWERWVGGEEPEVVGAKATVVQPEIDETMSAELRFPSGVIGRVRCSMAKGVGFEAQLSVRGTRGIMKVTNPIAPQMGCDIRIEAEGEEPRSETVSRSSPYRFQLEAFRDAVLEGKRVPTGGEDAMAGMRLLDATYRAAGLSVRGT